MSVTILLFIQRSDIQLLCKAAFFEFYSCDISLFSFIMAQKRATAHSLLCCCVFFAIMQFSQLFSLSRLVHLLSERERNYGYVGFYVQAHFSFVFITTHYGLCCWRFNCHRTLYTGREEKECNNSNEGTNEVSSKYILIDFRLQCHEAFSEQLL
jgi:hypothetical protein